MIPLADTTIYELEKAGKFPKRVYLTARCVAWELSEIEAWITERRAAILEPTFSICAHRNSRSPSQKNA